MKEKTLNCWRGGRERGERNIRSEEDVDRARRKVGEVLSRFLVVRKGS